MPNLPLSGEFVLTPPNTTPSPAPTPETPNTTPSPDPVTGIIHNHIHTKPKFYSSLCQYPTGVTFQNQEADEEVILLIRRDFITNVPWIISILLLALTLPLLFILVPIFFPNIQITQPLMGIALASYYLVLFSFTILNFTIWYFNAGIVTSKRIVDLDVPNILIKEASEARLSSIADVTFNQTGTIRSFFDYGDVEVQTEAIKANIEFDRAPNPNFIRKTIGDLVSLNPSS